MSVGDKIVQIYTMWFSGM